MGPSWPWSYGSWIYSYLCNQCLLPLMLRVRIPLRARCTTLCDKVCQWLEAGRWFSSGPPVSSTNKTDCHNITEIMLKVVYNTINPKLTFLILCCYDYYDFCVKTMFDSFSLLCFVGGSCFIYVICIYLYIMVPKLDFHIRWCSCRLTVTQLVLLVEQKLLTLPGLHEFIPVLVGFVLLNP